MKTILIRILVILTLATMICSSALASNVCTYVSGGLSKSVTFTVKTDSKWYTINKITLTATKGTYTAANTARTQTYWSYHIKVKSSAKTEWIDWDGTSSKTINGLKSNTSYTITVTPYTFNEWKTAHPFKAAYAGDDGSSDFSMQWNLDPTWSVKKTSGMTLCK